MLFDAHRDRSRRWVAWLAAGSTTTCAPPWTGAQGKGSTVNARFAVMCAHYRYDPDFCNVAFGWEKGVVEKNVQDSGRRIWIDARVQRFTNMDALNAWLGERCRALWQEVRYHEHNQFSVAEMLEHERLQLMPMPAPFDGYPQSASTMPASIPEVKVQAVG